MKEKGQAFSTFQLLIAAIVAVAILIILMQILGIITLPGPGDDPAVPMSDALKEASTSLASTKSARNINFTSDSPIVTSESIIYQAEIGLEPWQVCLSPGQFFEADEVQVDNVWGDTDKAWQVRADGMALRYARPGGQRTVNAIAICHHSGTALREYIDLYMGDMLKEDWMSGFHGGGRFECECLSGERSQQKCCLIALRYAS